MKSSGITKLRRFSCGCIIPQVRVHQLALLLVLLLGLTYAYSQTEDVRSRLCNTFEEWDEKWDKQTVDEFVDEIIHLANRHTGGLSEVQLREITNGLRGMQNVGVVTELTHPLEKEVSWQYLRYGITNYLTLEPGDKQQQAQLLQQFNNLVGKYEKNLRDEFPGFEGMISKAVEDARYAFTNESKNPLRRNFKRPLNPELIEGISKRWTEALATLKEELAPELATDKPFKAQIQILGALLTSIYSANEHTQLQVLPRPKELIEAENNFLDNVPLMRKWREEKHDEMFRKLQEKTEIEEMVKRQGLELNDSFYLNQVGTIGGPEASGSPGVGQSGEEILPTYIGAENDTDKQSGDEKETDHSLKNNFRTSVIAVLRTPMISAGIFVFLLVLLALLYVKRTGKSRGEV